MESVWQGFSYVTIRVKSWTYIWYAVYMARLVSLWRPVSRQK